MFHRFLHYYESKPKDESSHIWNDFLCIILNFLCWLNFTVYLRFVIAFETVPDAECQTGRQLDESERKWHRRHSERTKSVPDCGEAEFGCGETGWVTFFVKNNAVHNVVQKQIWK